MIYFIAGAIIGCIFLEPIIINFIYFSNIGLFLDIFLTKKNRYRLIKFIEEIENDKK